MDQSDQFVSSDGGNVQSEEKLEGEEANGDVVLKTPPQTKNYKTLERKTKIGESRFWRPRSQQVTSVEAIDGGSGLRKFRDSHSVISLKSAVDRKHIRTRRNLSQKSPNNKLQTSFSKDSRFPEEWKSSLSNEDRRVLEREIALEMMAEKKKSLRNMFNYFSRVHKPESFVQNGTPYNLMSDAAVAPLFQFVPSGEDLMQGPQEGRLAKREDWSDIDMQVWG